MQDFQVISERKKKTKASSQTNKKKERNMHYSWPGCRLLEEIDNLTHTQWCQTRDRNWRYQGEALG